MLDMSFEEELKLTLAREPDSDARDGLDGVVQDALRALRLDSGMDVAFVSRFEDGKRIIELVDQDPGVVLLPAGTCDSIEHSWCHRVATGALPKLMIDAGSFVECGAAPRVELKIGTHISVPIILGGGHVFGTLCAFSATVNPRAGTLDLHRLQGAAHLLARRIDGVRAR